MWQRLKLANADVRLKQKFLPAPAATELFDTLVHAIAWRRDSVKLFGKSLPIPRLHQWYADAGLEYTWSGLTMTPQPWLKNLVDLRQHIERASGRSFNSVLINLYRDGSDSMGWHSDDEPELGIKPAIASLSLGVERDFFMRRRDNKAKTSKHCLKLGHGSLLLMQGDTQQFWQHALPKRRRINAARINLTFRLIQPQENRQ